MNVKLDRSEEDLAETHEINVTPFIDVMLVLLIIFMVAAPLATVDIPVNLPEAAAEPAPKPDPVFLTLRDDLSLTLGDRPVTREELHAALERTMQGNGDEPIFLQADKSVNYGDLMGLMNRLRNAGYPKIALVGLEQDR